MNYSIKGNPLVRWSKNIMANIIGYRVSRLYFKFLVEMGIYNMLVKIYSKITGRSFPVLRTKILEK